MQRLEIWNEAVKLLQAGNAWKKEKRSQKRERLFRKNLR